VEPPQLDEFAPIRKAPVLDVLDIDIDAEDSIETDNAETGGVEANDSGHLEVCREFMYFFSYLFFNTFFCLCGQVSEAFLTKFRHEKWRRILSAKMLDDFLATLLPLGLREQALHAAILKVFCTMQLFDNFLHAFSYSLVQQKALIVKSINLGQRPQPVFKQLKKMSTEDTDVFLQEQAKLAWCLNILDLF
jgi:hypothetical protein